jgi:5-methylcytosine-specific restriction protein A
VPDIDPARFARRLAGRFGLALEGRTATVLGGPNTIIRSLDLTEPNGFAVVLSASARRAEAVFLPDQYAGPMMRAMSEADAAARESFIGRLTAAKSGGMEVLVLLDKAPASADDIRAGSWRSIEIECTQRIQNVEAGGDPAGIEDGLSSVATTCLSLVTSLLSLEEVETGSAGERGLPEGARISVIANRYERSPANRAACLEHYGPVCAACNFDFEAMYGELGAGYAEVHHIVPLSELGGSYVIDPITDLVPLCSNCHSMVHRVDPPMAIANLRKLIGSQERRSAEGPTDVVRGQNTLIQTMEAQIKVQKDELKALTRNVQEQGQLYSAEKAISTKLRGFLDPKIADVIVGAADPKILEGHRKSVVAIFCDLRNFTSFSLKTEPEDVMRFLKRYHSAIIPIIRKYDGTVDHFTGDGLLAYVEEPDQSSDAPARAAKLACEMRDTVGQMLLKSWEAEQYKLGFGMGMAQGHATLGRIGVDDRSDYTAIGTVINLAARLCSEAQNGQILVAGKLLHELDNVAELEGVGDRALKGLETNTRVSNVVRLKPQA